MSYEADYLRPAARRAAHRSDTYKLNFATLALVIIVLQAFLLICLGSGVVPVLSTAIIEFGCYLLIRRYGLSDINSGLILSLAIVHIIAASIIKIGLLQSLDENLDLPNLSFVITTLYFLSLFAAFFVARRLPLPMLKPLPTPTLPLLNWLTVLSLGFALLGAFGAARTPLANNFVQAANASNPFLVLTLGFPAVAMVCATLRVLHKTGNRRIIDIWSLGIVLLLSIVGLAANQRDGVLEPIIAIFVTGIYSGYRFGIRIVAGSVLLLAFFTTYLSPAFLEVRGERDYLSSSERIEQTLDVAWHLVIGDSSVTAARNATWDRFSESPWGRYFGIEFPFSDRIAMVQSTDAVAAATNNSDYVKFDEGSSLVAMLFPSALLRLFDVHVEKPYPISDFISWNIGLLHSNVISSLALPEDAEAYSVGGVLTVVYRTFLAYLACFCCHRIAVGRSRMNSLLSICIFILSYHIFAESGLVVLLDYCLRILPQFLVTFYIIFKSAQYLSRRVGDSPLHFEARLR